MVVIGSFSDTIHEIAKRSAMRKSSASPMPSRRALCA